MTSKTQNNEDNDVNYTSPALRKKLDDQSPWPYLNEYFKFMLRDKDKLTFGCKLCLPNIVSIKAHMSSINNLRQHVRRTHPGNVAQFENTSRTRGKQKKRKISLDSQSSLPPPPKHKIQEENLVEACSTSIGSNGVSQAIVNERIVDLFVTNALPFHIVESEAFKRLIETLNPSVTTMSIKLLHNEVAKSNCDLQQHTEENSKEIPQNALQNENCNRDDESTESEEEQTKKKSRKKDTALHKVLDCMKMVCKTTAKRDQYSIFGEYIAHKLRNCKEKSSDCEVAQQQIENIVHNLALESSNYTATMNASKDDVQTSYARPSIENIILKIENEF